MNFDEFVMNFDAFTCENGADSAFRRPGTGELVIISDVNGQRHWEIHLTFIYSQWIINQKLVKKKN